MPYVVPSMLAATCWNRAAAAISLRQSSRLAQSNWCGVSASSSQATSSPPRVAAAAYTCGTRSVARDAMAGIHSSSCSFAFSLSTTGIRCGPHVPAKKTPMLPLLRNVTAARSCSAGSARMRSSRYRRTSGESISRWSSRIRTQPWHACAAPSVNRIPYSQPCTASRTCGLSAGPGGNLLLDHGVGMTGIPD